MTFDLTGKLLISTPAMGDPRFKHSVIYLCAHSVEGAFGLVINRPVPELSLASVLDQLNIPVSDTLPARPILAGGPVEAARGFVLFRCTGTGSGGAGGEGLAGQAEAALPGGLSLSASPEILAAIARGEGPSDWFLALGYAGWGPGQLESEIAQNAWLTGDADGALLFSTTPGEHLWKKALLSMGIDPLGLSAVAGHA